jgi:hypothetical protein
MKSASAATTPYSPSPGHRVSYEGGLLLRIGDLLQERDALHEEVRQLHAALQIYTEVVRRLQVIGQQRAA